MKNLGEKKAVKQNSILRRVVKDLAEGLVMSTILCWGLSKVYEIIINQFGENVIRIDASNPDILFTQLSLVFLVISFVTLLANKTETVFWVDVIQYRLIKPRHTSVVDITTFIFANLIISLISFFSPVENDIILFSFFMTIILLGFLCFKLLIAFFGISSLKEELEEEYRNALDFRKTVCQLYNSYCNTSNEGYKFDLKTKKLYTNALTKITEPIERFRDYINESIDKYKDIDLENFGSALPVKTSRGNMQYMYNEVKNKRYSGGKLKLNNKYLFWLYMKVKKYERYFDNDIEAYASMRDNLYANIMRCIDEYKINDVSEQICFLFKYKEYEHALSCMEIAAKKCPLAFLDVFKMPFGIAKGNNRCIQVLNEQLNEIRNHEEYSIIKNSSAWEHALLFMANAYGKDCPEELLVRQFQVAVDDDDMLVAGVIYRIVRLDKAEDKIIKKLEKIAEQMSSEKNEEKTEDIVQKELDDLKADKEKDFLIKEVLKQNKVDFAFEMIKQYQQTLIKYVPEERDEHMRTNTLLPILLAMFGFGELLVEGCDLYEIYLLLEQKYNEGVIDQRKMIEFLEMVEEYYKQDYFVLSHRFVHNRMKYLERFVEPVSQWIKNNKIDINRKQRDGYLFGLVVSK